MFQRKTTKEEKLLLAIQKQAKGLVSSPVDVGPIVETLGFSEKQARHALHLLARGNFIIKKEEWVVELTPHGLTQLHS